VDHVKDKEIAEPESTLADLCVEEEQLARKKGYRMVYPK